MDKKKRLSLSFFLIEKEELTPKDSDSFLLQKKYIYIYIFLYYIEILEKKKCLQKN